MSLATVDSFASDLGEWWSANDRSHVAFVARRAAAGVVGMAWLALVPRVPRPGTTGRCSGDIQSVFVLPEERGKGLGAGLIAAASTYALGLGAGRVVVQSGRRAVPLYERLGFASSPQLLQTPAQVVPCPRLVTARVAACIIRLWNPRDWPGLDQPCWE